MRALYVAGRRAERHDLSREMSKYTYSLYQLWGKEIYHEVLLKSEMVFFQGSGFC